MSRPKKTELTQENNTALTSNASAEPSTDAILPEAALHEPDAHQQLVETALQNPGVQAAYDKRDEEIDALVEELKQRSEVTESAQDEVATASPKVPVKIKMVKNFRIEYPLPCRRDTSMCMRLKENQIITDKYLIKYLSQNPDAPFIVIE